MSVMPRLVLNVEQNSLIVVPGIQEDLRKSSESTSTLDSESYALENLEVDLFDNLRASIQMTIGKRDKASSDMTDAPRLGSVKKIDLPRKMKPPVNLKKDGVSKQQLQYTSNEAIIGVKAVKVDRDCRAAKGSGRSNSLSRPPRIVPKPMSKVPSCKIPSGSIQLKDNTRKALSGEVIRQSVVASDKTNGKSSSVTSRTNSSLKPSNSTFKFSSKISPHSSIDSVLSDSSSASNTTNPSNSVESLGASSTSPSRSLAAASDVDFSQASDMHLFTIGQSLVRKETYGTLSQSQHIASAGSRCSKPSGLRLPSPKIGYFDAKKTIVCSSNKLSQTSLRSNLVKSTIETSNIADANKLKSTKIPSVRTTVQPVAMNFAHSTMESPKQQSYSTRLVSPMSICPPSELDQKHRDLSPNTSKDDHNMVFASAEVADMVHLASAATIHTENINDQGRVEDIYLVTNYEKENLSPASETNRETRDFTSESKNISIVEMLGKKIFSLSLSETSDIVSGD